jgi:hypothetical protein
VFANAYYLGCQAIINLTARHQEEMGLTQPIDFIFDEQAEKQRMRAAWDGYLEGKPAQVRNLAVDESDANVLPLQAADLFTWWIRQYWLKHGTISRSENIGLLWQHEIPWLAAEYDENGLLKELLHIGRAVAIEA